MNILIFIICLSASTMGAVCGIGGGVIIKPLLDAFNIMSAQTVSFLSGCTVLSMSGYSVLTKRIRSRRGNSDGDYKYLPLIIGAGLDGVFGKWLFKCVCGCFSGNGIFAIQAACLLLLTLGTFTYTLNESKIHTLKLTNLPLTALIGLSLGVVSSFLGIGGGPVNVVALSFCFSMPSREARMNSLKIVFFSQVCSLLMSLLSGTVPAFSWATLSLMVCAGITGGIIGRRLNAKIELHTVRKLFLMLNLCIVIICAYNIIRNI